MTGVEMIAAERRRQAEVEGWTAAHDDTHARGEMALAAAVYATPVPLFEKRERRGVVEFADAWPWHPRWDKREKHERLKQLAIAGALIAAEIDRLQRRAQEEGQ